MENPTHPPSISDVREKRIERIDSDLKSGTELSKKQLLHLLREANVVMDRQAAEIRALRDQLKKKPKIWLPGRRG